MQIKAASSLCKHQLSYAAQAVCLTSRPSPRHAMSHTHFPVMEDGDAVCTGGHSRWNPNTQVIALLRSHAGLML